MEPALPAELFHKHVCQTSPYSVGLEVVRGEGCYLYDAQGKRYLDFIAGIAVNNVGHSHPRVVEAVCRQMRLYAHTMVYGEHVQVPQVELAREIASVAPVGLDSVYFLTTGAEANDAALKLAVKLTGRSRIIAFYSAYHGDTVGAMACFGSEAFRRQFQSILPKVDFISFNDEEGLEKIDSSVAAVIVEPVQGEAGIIPSAGDFLKHVRERCTDAGALLIFDEVQTAFGRVGDWFASNLFRVTPDIITIAKAMGGGLPLAGVVGACTQMNRFAADPPFSHITTFGGHPVSCAAGLEAMRVMRDEKLLGNANAQGEYLLQHLRSIDHGAIQDVRGSGLMIGVELDSQQRARAVVESCRRRGVIFETTLLNEKVVRFSPPLIVTKEQCDEALNAFSNSVEEA